VRDVLVKEPAVAKRRIAPDSNVGWNLLGWAGWAFLAIGLLDVGLAWIPLNLGSVEWEFGTITRSFDSLPLPFLGTALIMGSGLARGKLWWGRVAVTVLVVLAVWIVVCAVLYGLNIPVALRSVQQPIVLLGIKKAIVRTGLQMGLYLVAISGMAWLGMRTFFGKSTAPLPSQG
jgi:hypothetical protein